MERALNKQLGKKVKALALNQSALDIGVQYAAEHLPKRDGLRIARANLTAGKILIEGNAAAALGCMMAGVTVVTWYPITPSSSLCETLTGYMRKYRMDRETGKATFAIVQAEDELSALGMALGGGWAGARSMTATSGPGISLMAEFAGLGYYAEVPAVVFDIQRVGPSTGLPTRTAQGDILSTAVVSHGDTKHPMLLPASVDEIYTMAMDAFDLAERLQTPIFVMSDLDLGMNTWMADRFEYPERPPDRGKVLDPARLQELKEWGRYLDVDGDAIPYRTLPGDGLPAYFCRGSGHNERGQYTERPEDYVHNVDRLARKFETARTLVPPPVVELVDGAEVGIVGYGTSHWAIDESRAQLAETGLKVSYLRLRAYPFSPDVDRFIDRHARVYVVDQNRDAQMRRLLAMELSGERAAKLRSVLHYNGLPIDARSITDGVLSQAGLAVAGTAEHGPAAVGGE
jgi:2-oxoglutarate ferredoxin oxidoreductase subunit alpha